MRIVNIHQAKTHLSRLLEAASEGEEIVIARAGKPIARLVAYDGVVKGRQPGLWQGQIQMAPDYEEWPEEVVQAFRGERP